jgi:hypothetical protein
VKKRGQADFDMPDTGEHEDGRVNLEGTYRNQELLSSLIISYPKSIKRMRIERFAKLDAII